MMSGNQNPASQNKMNGIGNEILRQGHKEKIELVKRISHLNLLDAIDGTESDMNKYTQFSLKNILESIGQNSPRSPDCKSPR